MNQKNINSFIDYLIEENHPYISSFLAMFLPKSNRVFNLNKILKSLLEHDWQCTRCCKIVRLMPKIERKKGIKKIVFKCVKEGWLESAKKIKKQFLEMDLTKKEIEKAGKVLINDYAKYGDFIKATKVAKQIFDRELTSLELEKSLTGCLRYGYWTEAKKIIKKLNRDFVEWELGTMLQKLKQRGDTTAVCEIVYRYGYTKDTNAISDSIDAEYKLTLSRVFS